MRKVELRMNEEYKYKIIKKLVETNGNKQRAAVTLKRSIRQIDRMIAGYKEYGKAFFVHGNRDRKPKHALTDEFKTEIELLYINKYFDCTYTKFTEFLETSFIKCEFNNCKVSGCNFAEDRLYNVAFIETNASYMNLSMASIENILFKNTGLKSSYFQETKIKNLYFENSDLTGARFFKTSLKGIDLSSSKIEGIAISIEDIKGAIIDQFQETDLLYLIGVKIK